MLNAESTQMQLEILQEENQELKTKIITLTHKINYLEMQIEVMEEVIEGTGGGTRRKRKFSKEKLLKNPN